MKQRLILPLMLWGACTLFTLQAQQQELVLLHTNDTHSHIETSYGGEDGNTLLGGVLRRKALVDSIRQADPIVLLVDAGDFCQGTPYFNLYKGEVEIEMMNALGYNVATIGNHEFDNGVEAMAQMFEKAEFDIVAANYDVSNSPLAPLVKPYVVYNYDGIEVAFIGLCVEPKGLVATENYEGVIYLDPTTVANDVAAKLKAEGVDLIVGLSHLGHRSDVKLAENSRNIDIIIGGHSHTKLETPDRVVNLDGKEVVIGQNGGSGLTIGYMQVSLDPEN